MCRVFSLHRLVCLPPAFFLQFVPPASPAVCRVSSKSPSRSCSTTLCLVVRLCTVLWRCAPWIRRQSGFTMPLPTTSCVRSTHQCLHALTFHFLRASLPLGLPSHSPRFSCSLASSSSLVVLVHCCRPLLPTLLFPPCAPFSCLLFLCLYREGGGRGGGGVSHGLHVRRHLGAIFLTDVCHFATRLRSLHPTARGHSEQEVKIWVASGKIQTKTQHPVLKRGNRM